MDSEKIDMASYLAEQTETKEPGQNDDHEVDENDFSDEPIEVEAEEIEEDPKNSVDPKDFAEMLIMVTDIGQTTLFTHLERKKIVKKLSKEDLEIFEKLELGELTEDSVPEGKEDVLKIFNKHLEETDLISFSDSEIKNLTPKTAAVIAKYNFKITPEMALLGSVFMVFAPRVYSVLKS